MALILTQASAWPFHKVPPMSSKSLHLQVEFAYMELSLQAEPLIVVHVLIACRDVDIYYTII